MTTLRKEMFRVGFLKITTSELIAWNLRCNRQHRNTAAMAVVESVDQMQVTWTTTSSAHRQIPGEVSFRSRRECCGFFMPDGYPLDVVPRSDRFGNSIEGVSGKSVDPLNPSCHQSVNEQMCNRFIRHIRSPLLF
jgi:hypothetical protein